MKRRYLVAIVLASLCICGSFVLTQTHSAGVGEYNPWLDINDNGHIDGSDIAYVARAFGTAGTDLTKASVQYDSGWIDITDKQGQDIVITHDLNITDWNDEKVMMDIAGKTALDGELHRHLGLYQQQGWNKTYGGTNYDDWAYALVQTADGGYALAGYTYSFGAGNGDFWLVKTDSAGNALWNMTYRGTGDGIDYAFDLVQTVDGGYALAGSTSSFNPPLPWDSWLVKTDAHGNALGGEYGLAWIDSTANTIALYRGAQDPYWNYVRVRMLKQK